MDAGVSALHDTAGDPATGARLPSGAEPVLKRMRTGM
jgi:hypothetical protein